MSSHMFEEVEDTCDKVALIKDGKIIAVKSTLEIKHNEDKEYKIEFLSATDSVSSLRDLSLPSSARAITKSLLR